MNHFINKYKNYLIVLSGLLLGLLAYGFKSALTNRSGGIADDKSESFLDKINVFKSEKTQVPSVLFASEYTVFCEEQNNCLHSVKQVGDFNFEAFYKPINYLSLKELNNNINEDTFNEKKKEYGNMEYFSFKLSAKDNHEELLKYNLSNENEYYQRIEYFSFKAQSDFKLISNTDTVLCSLFHFERTFNLVPHITFILGFPKTVTSKINTLKIMYDDKVFNNGKIILGFDTEEINKIPQPKFN